MKADGVAHARAYIRLAGRPKHLFLRVPKVRCPRPGTGCPYAGLGRAPDHVVCPLRGVTGGPECPVAVEVAVVAVKGRSRVDDQDISMLQTPVGWARNCRPIAAGSR